MKVKLPQEALADALAVVAKAVSAKNTIPVLAGIYLQAEAQTLTLRATDLELAIESKIDAAVEVTGSVVLPARYLADLVRKIPYGDIFLTVDTENYTATLMWEKSRYTIHGFQPDQFPYLPEVGEAPQLAVASEGLRNLLRRTIFAVSHDDTRPYLTGVSFRLGEGVLSALATDSVRIAGSQLSVQTDGAQQMQMIVPGRALHELLRLLGAQAENEIKVSLSDSHVLFDLGHTRLLSRLLEGQFPDVMRLVPNEYGSSVRLHKASFIEACERAALLAKDGAVKLAVQQDMLVITSNAPEVGQVYEELAASLDGDPVEIGFNSRYLIEGLKATDTQEFTFEFSGARNPSRIRIPDGDPFVYIVLPLITT